MRKKLCGENFIKKRFKKTLLLKLKSIFKTLRKSQTRKFFPMKKFLIFALKYFRFAFRITPHLRDRWVFRYRKLSIHEERLYSSERTQLAFSATAQMRETLYDSAEEILQNFNLLLLRIIFFLILFAQSNLIFICAIKPEALNFQKGIFPNWNYQSALRKSLSNYFVKFFGDLLCAIRPNFP